jgi:hypothetical protein
VHDWRYRPRCAVLASRRSTRWPSTRCAGRERGHVSWSLPLLSCRSKDQLSSPRLGKPLIIKAVPQNQAALVAEASIALGPHSEETGPLEKRLSSLELLGSVNQTPSPSTSSHVVCTSLLSDVRRTKMFWPIYSRTHRIRSTNVHQPLHQSHFRQPAESDVYMVCWERCASTFPGPYLR